MMCVQKQVLQIMGRRIISKQMRMRMIMVTMIMLVVLRKVVMVMEVVMVIVELDRSHDPMSFWKCVLYPK